MTAKRILLVDDEPLIRELGEEVLTECGYEVVTSGDGEEAFRLLLDQPFDAAIVDLKLPDIDGVELLRRIRTQEIPLPVWIMTGFGSFDSCLECARLGVQGYLPKPFSIQDLTSLIEATFSTGLSAQPSPPSSALPPEGGSDLEPTASRQPLTPREKEVLGYIRHGLTDSEIAQKLFVSDHTIHNHVKHIVEKLGVKNRVEAVSVSYQEDLF